MFNHELWDERSFGDVWHRHRFPACYLRLFSSRSSSTAEGEDRLTLIIKPMTFFVTLGKWSVDQPKRLQGIVKAFDLCDLIQHRLGDLPDFYLSIWSIP